MTRRLAIVLAVVCGSVAVHAGDLRATRFSEGRVRHVSLLESNGLLHVVFSAIGDAPESILYATVPMKGDWDTWRIGSVSKVLVPETAYECPDLPLEKSEVGEIDRPARQLRDPALFSDEGRLYLFYTFCGEQGIAGAEVTLAP